MHKVVASTAAVLLLAACDSSSTTSDAPTASAVTGEAPIRVTELVVEEQQTAGVPYPVALRYEGNAGDVTEVCLNWGQGDPSCFDDIAVDSAAGLISTTARTTDPAAYILSGYVVYGADRQSSNVVSTSLKVSPRAQARAQSQAEPKPQIQANSQTKPRAKPNPEAEAAATTAPETTAPETTASITPPAAQTVNAEPATFHRNWAGTWKTSRGEMQSKLIIDRIDEDGSFSGTYVFWATITSVQGKIDGDVLAFELGRARFEFRTHVQGHLEAKRFVDGVHTESGVFSKV